MISRLDRYVISEATGPIVLGFVVSTFMLLIRAFFELAEAIIRKGVEPMIVLKLLALNLPHIVVITIPMALLFGILVAVGRLTADSELTALRAAGVSLFYLFRAVLLISLSLTLVNVVLMLFLMPWGNRTYTRLLIEQMAGSVTEEIEPRVFTDLIEDRTLYIFEAPPGQDHWNGVFMAESLPLGDTQFTVAEGGSIRLEERGARIIVELENAIEQQLDLGAPTEAHVSSHKLLTLVNEDPSRGGIHQSRGGRLRELYWHQLVEWANDPERPAEARALARVEMHKKFSIPAACLVFGLVALPVGFSRRRGGGRSSAFAQSIGIIAVYYVLQNLGEEGAANGKMAPWLSMWLPNLLYLVGGAFLLARKNSDKSLLLARVDLWFRVHLWSHLDRLRAFVVARQAARAARRSGSGPTAPAAQAVPPNTRFLFRVPHIRLRFPGRIDRYVLRIFGTVAMLVVIATLTIYIIVDLTELARFVLENDVNMPVVIRHYQYFSLQILYTIAPVAVLLTTLVTFGLLTRTSEVTAARALGISLYRLSLPVVAAGAVASLAVGFLDFSVLPVTNARAGELRNQIKNYQGVGFRRATHQWFYSQTPDGGSFIYNFLHFNPQQELLLRFQAFRFDDEHRLTGHLYASELRRSDDERWLLRDGWSRTFEGPRVTSFEELAGPLPIDLDQPPEFFSTEIKRSVEMNYLELRDYVRRITSSGQQVPDLETQLASKVSTPVVCLVMVFVALPFAFRLGRQGALYGVGVAVILAIVLYVVMAFFATLGEVGALPPQIAAWAPNALFGLLSLYLFLGIRT
jgi:LPS export ABC transporter permease LptG/LPS export ABC transporter permease LptF